MAFSITHWLGQGLENNWVQAFLLAFSSVLISLILCLSANNFLDARYWSRIFLCLIFISSVIYSTILVKDTNNSKEKLDLPWYRWLAIIIAPIFALIGEAVCLTFINYTDLDSSLQESGELGHLLRVLIISVGGLALGWVGIWCSGIIITMKKE